MIQDIAPHRLFNQYDPAKRPDADSRLIHFKGNQILSDPERKENCFPHPGELSGVTETIYLFSIDSEAYFYVTDETVNAPGSYSYYSLRDYRKAPVPKEMIFAAITAWQLIHWYRDNVFCGTCGSRTILAASERAVKCPHCGRRIYPRIVPAVIVGVTNGDEIVLTKYAGGQYKFYALIAGFTEIGETLEETVAREVMEEVGLKVKNIRYYKSQPWGSVDDILAGFYCDVDGDPDIHLDERELKVGVWTRREDIELQPDEFSLTNEMMMMFKLGKEPR